MNRRVPDVVCAERWWPLASRPTDGRWYADHVATDWWDAGDPHGTRVRQGRALADELLGSLPSTGFAPGTRVLEFGGGPGMTLQELALRTACDLVAWDPCAEQRAAAADLVPGAAVVDALDGIEDGAVDVVWAPRCFAHDALDWAALLAAAHRVLRPGGHLVAVTAGPGVWAWEPDGADWDEEGTGLLIAGLGRGETGGGPLAFCSRWWLREHWGRGFDEVSLRPAGVTMSAPDHGYGLGVWRRHEGPPLTAETFAALTPGDERAGRAFRRQLAHADAEARTLTERRRDLLHAARVRAELLRPSVAVDDDPRVRAAQQEVDALAAEVASLQADRWWRATAPLRRGHERWREVRS